MKKIYSILGAFGLFAMTFMISSCMNEKDYSDSMNVISAVVTIKYDNSDRCYFQVEKDKVVYPTNVNKPYNGKEVRALTQYELLANDEARVFYLDSILTKKPVVTVGDDDAKVYGNDPIDILGDWCTVAEDGYITFHFRTLFSGPTKHYVNLVTGINPENPYEVEFRHDAKGDLAGTLTDGYAAFNIKDLLPEDTSNVVFTVHFKSYSGDQVGKLAYK